MTNDKDSLRKMLAAAVAQKVQEDPDAVTRYAAVPPVTRRPWSKRKATPNEQAYQEELQKIERASTTLPSVEDDFSLLAKEASEFSARRR